MTIVDWKETLDIAPAPPGKGQYCDQKQGEKTKLKGISDKNRIFPKNNVEITTILLIWREFTPVANK